MHIISVLIILLLLVGVLVWLFMERPKQQLEGVWSNVASSLNLKSQDYSIPLRMWAEEELGEEPQLQTWLLGLSEEALPALGEKIHELGVDMDLDLSWLTDPESEGIPEAQQASKEMVVDYCKLCMKAVHKQQMG